MHRDYWAHRIAQFNPATDFAQIYRILVAHEFPWDMNQALSQRRADSVATYLTGRGVAVARVTAVGEGFSSPVADNNTDAGRQANRRVEVIIQNAAP